MDFYDYLLLVVTWILGAVYGWYARERYAIRTIDRIMSDVYDATSEDETNSRIYISIEKHNGVFYVYDKEKNEFMAQGSTRKELETNLAKRYPDKHFAADTESLKVLK